MASKIEQSLQKDFFFKNKVISGSDQLKKIVARDKQLFLSNFATHSRPSSHPVKIKEDVCFQKNYVASNVPFSSSFSDNKIGL